MRVFKLEGSARSSVWGSEVDIHEFDLPALLTPCVETRCIFVSQFGLRKSIWGQGHADSAVHVHETDVEIRTLSSRTSLKVFHEGVSYLVVVESGESFRVPSGSLCVISHVYRYPLEFKLCRKPKSRIRQVSISKFMSDFLEV